MGEELANFSGLLAINRENYISNPANWPCAETI
jgi:hypothetical protein